MRSSSLRSVDSLSDIQRSGLSRCTVASELLAGFGIIFKGGLSGLLAASNSTARFPTIQQVREAGAYVYGKSWETDHVDVFISHSWAAGRWAKFLALCLFFNLDIAIKSSFATWFIIATIFVVTQGWTGMGGKPFLFPGLVCLPVATFFLVFLFGHQISTQRLWVDRVCVHQADLDLKREQIAALPCFVAHSSRFLILWDETYWERLWCNLELATFAHYGAVEKVDLVPSWLSPWLICSILLDLLSASLYELLEHVAPNWSVTGVACTNLIIDATQSAVGNNPVIPLFELAALLWIVSGIVYIPACLPSFFSFRMKLRNHQLLLDQMATFDVRAAKCTLSEDRKAIEDQIAALFAGIVEVAFGFEDQQVNAVDDGEVRLQRFNLASEEEALGPSDRFNAHVRGPLRSFVISQIGSDLTVPWRLALTAFLPMIFNSSVNLLSCDNGPCETSAALAGYSSVGQYMATQAAGWALCIFLAFPVTCPVLLRMMRWSLSLGDGYLQHFLALLCCPLAYVYSYICGGLIWGYLGEPSLLGAVLLNNAAADLHHDLADPVPADPVAVLHQPPKHGGSGEPVMPLCETSDISKGE